MTATMTRREPDNRLSLAASAVWRFRTADPDPMGDPSGDCGDLIAEAERRHLLRLVAAWYATPGEYNAALRRALGVAPGGLGPMSRHVYNLLTTLEVEDTCDRCGAALDVTSHRTRAYGGGWDTFYHCPGCGRGDVCT